RARVTDAVDLGGGKIVTARVVDVQVVLERAVATKLELDSAASERPGTVLLVTRRRRQPRREHPAHCYLSRRRCGRRDVRHIAGGRIEATGKWDQEEESDAHSVVKRVAFAFSFATTPNLLGTCHSITKSLTTNLRLPRRQARGRRTRIRHVPRRPHVAPR